MTASGGPPGSQVRAAYEPAALVGQIKGRTRLPKFYFEVGKDDYPRALEASERMRALLQEAGVAFEFAQREGDHSWAYAAEGMSAADRAVSRGSASPWLRPLASLTWQTISFRWRSDSIMRASGHVSACICRLRIPSIRLRYWGRCILRSKRFAGRCGGHG